MMKTTSCLRAFSPQTESATKQSPPIRPVVIRLIKSRGWGEDLSISTRHIAEKLGRAHKSVLLSFKEWFCQSFPEAPSIYETCAVFSSDNLEVTCTESMRASSEELFFGVELRAWKSAAGKTHYEFWMSKQRFIL